MVCSSSPLVHAARLAALRGLCSRREASELLRRGQLIIDGRVAAVGDKVPLNAHVELEAAAAAAQHALVSVVLHKPVGYLSQSSEPLPHQSFAQDLLTWANHFSLGGQGNDDGRPPARLPKMACAGRLDEASSGLLVFTQHGAIARSIVGPDGGLDKEYLVRVRPSSSPMAPLESEEVAVALARMRELEAGEYLRASEVAWSEPGAVLRIILRQGRKRQIRRMLSKIGLPALELHRTRIGHLRLDALPVVDKGAREPKGAGTDAFDGRAAGRAAAAAAAAETIALPPGRWAFFDPRHLWGAENL
jgi:23S rRNA pseudouridine2604 synthase